MPRSLRRYILHFEAAIEDAVLRFAGELEGNALVLDAGAGEGQYAKAFAAHRYVGVDLAVGDSSWNYSALDVQADLAALPFRDAAFDAALNIVTLEHVPEPAKVLREIARSLRPGGRLLIVAPHEWEEHQQPHDYYRYTRFGLRYLLEASGFTGIEIAAGGGYFRLLARRLLNGIQFFPGPAAIVAALFLGPPALILPLLDPLDRRRNFTLGYICTARRA